MSVDRYSTAERGGGSGDTGRMRAAILNQIDTWMAQAKWEDPKRAEALEEKLHEAPERFISPNPGTDYKEEATRVYEKLKDEYGLRPAGAAERRYRDLEDKADRRARRKRREKGFSAFESDEPTFRFDSIDVELTERPTSTEPVDIPAPAERPDLVQSAEPVDEPQTAEPQHTEPTAEPQPVDEPQQMGLVRLFAAAIAAILFASNSHNSDEQTPEQQKITNYQ